MFNMYATICGDSLNLRTIIDRHQSCLPLTMTRPDRRSSDDLRPIIAEFDSLARADGSARFGFGLFSPSKHIPFFSHFYVGTSPSALASFTGPIEVRLAAENPSRLTLDVLVRPLCGVPSVHEKKMGTIISSVLKRSLVVEASPRTAIVLVVQALSEDDSLASMINAASMASMAAASVPMRGVVCAVAVAVLNGDFLVDPTPEEIRASSASGCFAFHVQGEGRSESVWTNWHSGDGFDEQELLEARRAANVAVGKVWAAMKDAVGARQGLKSDFEYNDDGDMEI